MSDVPWWHGAPATAFPVIGISAPTIQAAQTGEGWFSEGGKTAPSATGWVAGTETFRGGGKAKGWHAPLIRGALVGWRACWVHKEQGRRPWREGYPGEGFRSRVQALLSLSSSIELAILTAGGIQGGSLADACRAAETFAMRAERDTGRPWPSFAFAPSWQLGKPEGDGDQQVRPVRLTWGVNAEVAYAEVAYIGHATVAKIEALRASPSVVQWLGEWS